MIGNVAWEAAPTEGVWIGQVKGPSTGEGSTVAILGGVHGDEPTGIQVVRESLDSLTIDRGTVILMLGNLAAMGGSFLKRPKRFKDVNLNRSFRELTLEEKSKDPAELPYEVRRAQDLLPYLDMAGAALDLHDFTMPCEPFIICEPNSLDTARAIGAPILSLGWSKTEPGGSDGYMYSKDKEGLCYELGRKKYPKQNLERGHGAVARFLIAKGLLEGNLSPLDTDPRMVQTRVATKRIGPFEWARHFHNFEELEAGELIAVHAGQEVRAQEGDVIIFPTKKPKIGEEAFTLGYRVSA